jgi:signal peptidase II
MTNHYLDEELETGPVAQERRLGRSGKTLVALIIVALTVALDQVTKAIAGQQLASAGRLSYIGDIFRLQYSENTGAFLSLGANLPPALQFWLFNVLVSVVLGAIFLSIIFSDDNRLPVIIAYGLIIGGGFGNLLDRFLNDGAVIDFMNLGLGWLRTGIFNVADMAITGGVIFLLVFGLRSRPKAQEPSPQEVRDVA